MKGTVIYAPSTFEDRGAAVAFTTPLLSQTRVRRNERHGIEILIPSFAEGKGIYVVPWRAIPDTVNMTVHDRFLHQLIPTLPTATPRDIRAATLRAQKSGLAGPDGVWAARAAQAQEEQQRTMTNFLLIVELLRSAGLRSMDVLTTGLSSKEGEVMARKLMATAAAGLNLGADELYARVAEMADLLAPVGLISGHEPGRLRQGLGEIADFADSARTWARDAEGNEAAPIADFCAQVAAATLALGERALSAFDKRVATVGAILRHWDDEVEEVRALAERVAWLVDGWSFVTQAWNASRTKRRYDQAMVVGEIFRILPLIPASETRAAQHEAAAEILSKNRRSVRMFEDWRTGSIDVDLVQRIETIKAKVA